MALITQTPQAYYDSNNYGNYQFTSLDDVINQFIIAYIGEDKIIPKAKRVDVAFHAQRAMQELSFDTFKSCKAQEFTVPATLQMPLPQDYVNYTKISWVDSAGIKHLMYPTSKTSNPSSNPLQDANGDFKLQAVGTIDGTTSDIVLDKEYKDILIGMNVTGGTLVPNTRVIATSNNAGLTTITVGVSGIAYVPSISITDATFTFTDYKGALILPQKSSHIIENLSWDNTLNDYKITGTASDLENLEIGMVLYHADFPDGTTILNVSGTTILVSSLPTTGPITGGEILFVSPDAADTDTWASYKSATPSENQDDYDDNTYWPTPGQRYGLEPQHAQVNGSYYIDCKSGKIHFSSNISGKTVILDYISDSLGTDGEMQVHKFAEEALYKWIIYGMISTRANIPEYVVRRYKKEKFAETRKAKLRLSNIKLEEITQILRGKSKQIKH